jgi:hypothetical protein
MVEASQDEEVTELSSVTAVGNIADEISQKSAKGLLIATTESLGADVFRPMGNQRRTT